MLPEFDLEDTFGVFLEKARKNMFFLYAFNVEEFIMEKYQKKPCWIDEYLYNKTYYFFILLEMGCR